MTQQCEAIVSEVRKYLTDSVHVRSVGNVGCILDIPFFDNEGDPIRVAIREEGGNVVIHDAALIAGNLFTLGQHTQDTPAFRLLRSLEKPYGLTLDFDNGTVGVTVPRKEMITALMDFTKVLLTITTAMPHIRVEPHRMKLAGPRLRTKVRDHFKQRKILELAQPDYDLPGETLDKWPVDYRWWVKRNGSVANVYIVLVDLNVLEAQAKAYSLHSMALDARWDHDFDSLRIVIDKRAEIPQSAVAASLIKNYGPRLKYKVYNFEDDVERRRFLEESTDELTSEAGANWREFWRQRAALS